jgi:hypothetical protein
MWQNLWTYFVAPPATYKIGVRILRLVVGQESREVLIGVKVVPVEYQHNMTRQIKVVQLAVGVSAPRLSNDEVPCQSVHLLKSWREGSQDYF